MTERCAKCSGKKFILKLGNIYGKCDACHGIGHVKAISKNKEETKPVIECIEEEVTQNKVATPDMRIPKEIRKRHERELLNKSKVSKKIELSVVPGSKSGTLD